MENKKHLQSRSLGLLVGFFFSIIGLFAAFIYPESSEDRENFVSGWYSGFVGAIILGVIVLLIASFYVLL